MTLLCACRCHSALLMGAIRIINSSRIRVQTMAIEAAIGDERTAVSCEMRSTCVFSGMTIEGGTHGLVAQDQSAVDVIGGSLLTGSADTGLGVFGRSSVNERPCALLNVDCEALDSISAEITGIGGSGLLVQGGSFAGTDNTRISDNGTGVFVQRGAVVKVLQNNAPPAGVGIIDNDVGLFVRASTAQVGTVVSGNSTGIEVGALSFVQNIGSTFSGNTANVVCTHPTAVSTLCPVP